MVTDQQAEAANDYIRDNAMTFAKAKAERIYIEQFRKSKKALLMNQIEGPEHIRDSFAYSHPEYLEVLEGLKQAVENEEAIRWRIVAAQAKIEIWRSQQANNRKGF